MASSKIVGVKNVEDLLQNPNYKKYYEKKLEIKAKYPPDIVYIPNKNVKSLKFKEGERELYHQYLKEVCDLMFEANGEFQEFIWDNISEYDTMLMERVARGRKIKPKIEY